MRLTKARIREYKSVWDSGEFQLGDITCLVGKNEAGKTALLEALQRINPLNAEDAEFDVTTDYPRSEVEDYRIAVEKGEREPTKVVTATYELEDSDLAEAIEEFGTAAFPSKQLTLTKDYSNKRTFLFDANEKAALQHIFKGAELPSSVLEKLQATKSASQALEVLTDAEETTEVSALKKKLGDMAKDGFPHLIYNNYLRKRVPKFLYFAELNQMTGAENMPALAKRKTDGALRPSDYPLLGLLELARLNVEEIQAATRTQDVINKLEGAGNTLGRRVLKYWSQNRHLQTRFDLRPGLAEDPPELRSGMNVYAQIYNTRHMVTTNLGTRSRGFVWFFSFLAWYNQIRQNGENVILLLDEPGLSLHGKAQADLLRFFDEEIEHQLVYTTHSPFLVDPRRFDRARIVQDRGIDATEELSRDEDGTKVLQDVLEASEDSLFPLQGALGYELYQTLFVGPNNLVVEGVSDLFYLQAMSALLESDGRAGLSPDWTITPVGGADKVPTFIALLGAKHGLKVATLIDFQKRDQQSIENLYKQKLLERSNVLTYADFVEQPEADVEDMFEVPFYLKLVSSEYKKSLDKELKEKDLKSRSPRVVVRLDQYFSESPLDSGAKFNHYRPARYFAENSEKLKKTIATDTLDRFEKAFKQLNSLLE